MEKISFDSQPTPTASAKIAPSSATPTTNSAFAATLAKENTMAKSKNLFLPLLLVVILLGVGTGYVIASSTTKPTVTVVDSTTDEQGASDLAAAVKVGQVFGAQDTSSFKDNAEGVLVAGGLEGEGSHHIVRPGGKTQTVYLTSSVLDLKMFEGHKVRVWGETFKAQKAGWLMDVGRAEVQELNAALPDGAQPEQLMEGGDF